MEWLGWLGQLKDIDPKLVAPLIAASLGIYLLLARRIKSIEARMTAVETSTATIASLNTRLDDLFDLMKVGLGVHHIERSPAPSPVQPASPGDELRLRELARIALGGRRDR